MGKPWWQAPKEKRKYEGDVKDGTPENRGAWFWKTGETAGHQGLHSVKNPNS